MTLPRDPVRFQRWSDRLQKASVVHSIPALQVLGCENLIAAYYGNEERAAWALLRKAVHARIRHAYWGRVYWLCDKIGWTRLQRIPDTVPTLYIRHSGKCDKFNCDDMDCVQRGIPAWYKRLTGML